MIDPESRERNTKMTRLSNLPCLLALALGLGCLTSLAREYEGSRDNQIVLKMRVTPTGSRWPSGPC